MIVITGSVTATPDTIDLLRAEGLAHSRRSRQEDGCLSHRLFQDAEEPLRLFFYEEWRDMAAVEAHFAHADTPRVLGVIRTHAVASDGPTILSAEPQRREGQTPS